MTPQTLLGQLRRCAEVSVNDRVEFVELLGRSNFSFLQGAAHPEEMVLRAQELGYRGFALCDLNGVYGVVRGFQAVEYPSEFLVHNSLVHPEFQYFLGAEMQLADGSSIVLMPQSRDGYIQLCQLITLSKRESQKGFSNLSFDSLRLHCEDLLAFPLPPWTLEKLVELREIFGDRLYLPVWKDYTWESLEIYRQALRLEESHNFELFATCRPFMARPEQKPLHDVITCILHQTTLLEARNKLLSNGERHLKELPELKRIWADRPDLLLKTVSLAKRIQFSLRELKYEYPEAARPEGVDATDYLRELVEEGLRRRFPAGTSEKVRKMVEHELSLISELRYEDYFLTLWDICRFALKRGILHQGRGSAANSVVCYCLGLTAVDPTQIELLFERFISRERGEPPDIDIDFESGRREEVIQYIYEKYGTRHAAMVCTVICYRGRMALRESAKVLGIDAKFVSSMIRYMGREGTARLSVAPQDLYHGKVDERTFRLVLELANAIKGFPRHLGIHTGGFIISKRPITECVPIEKATMDKRFVVQWNKDDINILGMLKIDVLGLGMLTALERSFSMLRQERNLSIDLYSIPPDDAATYAMIQKADTIGVFQIESRAQMSLLPRLKPKTFYDLVIEVAIVRPGPIQGGMIHPFIRRRHGLEEVTYPHEDLRPILEKTWGVPIFQEQIMQIASKVAGFTHGESDELRRIMSSSWKKADLMHGLRQRLISGMLTHGVELPYAEQIYQTIVGFASYGFPESHAASFALLTYASCFLKCHHPDVFTCALLNSQPMGFYSPRALIMDAQRHGVEFLPLDVQSSIYDYKLEGQSIRLGFRAVFGMKKELISNIVGEREARGSFQSLTDFIRRTQLERGVLMRLAAAGAFNCFQITPREALWQIQSTSIKAEHLFFGQSAQGRNFAQSNLLPPEDDWSALNREYNAQGFSVLHHPLSILRPALKKWSDWQSSQGHLPFTNSVELENCKNGLAVRIAGLLSLQQRPPTAKGFAFLTLEDEFGLLNVVLMPAVYQKFRLIILENPLLDITGRLQHTNGVINIKAEDIMGLPTHKLVEQIPRALKSSYDFSNCFINYTVG